MPETKAADPRPWKCDNCSDRFALDQSTSSANGHVTTWQPRAKFAGRPEPIRNSSTERES